MRAAAWLCFSFNFQRSGNLTTDHTDVFLPHNRNDMSMMASPFEILPNEIQCSIVRILDPASLISISQTCRKFRNLIQPKRKHFVERLLYLECLPEYGGEPYYFQPGRSRVEPAWDDPEWAGIRFACSGCLRLLPHTSFNNHQILGLGYKKPISDWTDSQTYTSWEPVVYGKHWGKKYWTKKQPRTEEEQKTHDRYQLACKRNDGLNRLHDTQSVRLEWYKRCGMGIFQRMDRAEFECLPLELEDEALDLEVLLIEVRRRGSKRHYRRCNECRFQAGQLAPFPNNWGGTTAVPMISSRQLLFANNIDRWFPGLDEFFGVERPEFSSRGPNSYGNIYKMKLWPMYMVRCPGCDTWQEIRAFRVCGQVSRWNPALNEPALDWEGRTINAWYIDNLRCNHCAAEDHRVGLGDYLVRLLLFLLEWELWQTQKEILQYFPSEMWFPGMTEEQRLVMTEVCDQTEWGMQKAWKNWTRRDMEKLSGRYRRWQELIRYWQKPPVHGVKGSPVLGDDPDGWSQVQKHWGWLLGIKEKAMGSKEMVRGNGRMLVEWALKRDGGSLK